MKLKTKKYVDVFWSNDYLWSIWRGLAPDSKKYVFISLGKLTIVLRCKK